MGPLCLCQWFKSTIVIGTIFFQNLRTNVYAEFLVFIDHIKQLFPMVRNHRSNEAMFPMYRSSLMWDNLVSDWVSKHKICNFVECVEFIEQSVSNLAFDSLY